MVFRVCAVAVLCVAATQLFSTAFLGGSPTASISSPPRNRQPAAPPTPKASTKWQLRKEALLNELREVNIKLAFALEQENKIEEVEEEDDAELIRLRKRYNIKKDSDRPDRPTSASRARDEVAQPVREARGLAANAAILRTAAGEIEWKCDEDCLALLSSDIRLSSSQIRDIDEKLGEDVENVQRKKRELEYRNRLQASADTGRRVERLGKFLNVVSQLRAKVAA